MTVKDFIFLLNIQEPKINNQRLFEYIIYHRIIQ